MAATPIPYNTIASQIKTILLADALTSGYTVEIETEPMFSVERTPWIGIYLSGREPGDIAASGGQSLSSAQRTRFNLKYTLVIVHVDYESLTNCIATRNTAMANVEVVLSKDRSIGNTVNTSYLTGGAVESGKGNNGFVAVSEIELIAEATLTTA